MSAGSIFISYRREDSAGEAGRLAEHLARRFGEDRVFIDIDAIAPGTDFVVALDRALTDTKVVLVLIGRQWLGMTNANGVRRLDDPADFVRREIESALERGTWVLPVLVQNVAMPSARDLPPAIEKLASRQAMAIQHEEFNDDSARLADAIARLLDPTAPRTPIWKRPSMIAGAIAVLALLGFAAMRWGGSAAPATAVVDSAQVTRQKQVDDIVRVATDQRGRRQFADAMATLDGAMNIANADVSQAKTLQQDIAMEWIRDLKVSDGQTFANAMKVPLAVLDQAAPFATGSRQGDLMAHLGWATFLRWRDGDRDLRPSEAYKRALAVDAKNPFANVMLGHLLLSYGNGRDMLDSARTLFRAALESGRETATVRRFQLAALRNDHTPAANLETLRVMDEMRRRGEPKDALDVGNVWATYYFALSESAALPVSSLMTVLPAGEHLQTFRWAFDDFTRGDDDRRLQYRFYDARFRAEAGETDAARDSLRALRAELAQHAGTLRDAVDRALTQLKPAPR